MSDGCVFKFGNSSDLRTCIKYGSIIFIFAINVYTCFALVRTRLQTFINSFAILKNASNGDTSLKWMGNYRLKHPELPVKMAARLKQKGYNFVLDMYGSGVELEQTKELVHKLGIEDVVKFKGNMPNAEILQAMRQHEIFLFTSDKNEGWGAVTNEAMSNACAIVASNAIGSVPFLVRDSENGMVFKSGCLDSLCEKVEFLLNNSEKRKEISRNALITMQNVWSPNNAVKEFLNLLDYIVKDDLENYKNYEGPASWA